MSERVSEAGVEAGGPERGRGGPLTLFEYLDALVWGLRLGLPRTLAKGRRGTRSGVFRRPSREYPA